MSIGWFGVSPHSSEEWLDFFCFVLSAEYLSTAVLITPGNKCQLWSEEYPFLWSVAADTGAINRLDSQNDLKSWLAWFNVDYSWEWPFHVNGVLKEQRKQFWGDLKSGREVLIWIWRVATPSIWIWRVANRTGFVPGVLGNVSLRTLNYGKKSRILTMWRKPGNSDIKSIRIYIWRRWTQSDNGWGCHGCQPKLQIHQGTL
jgi:hypothetical protein